MTDPFYRYGGLADRGIPSFPGYLPSEPPSLPSNHVNGFRDPAPDFMRREIAAPPPPSSYGLDHSVSGVSMFSEPTGINGAIPGASGSGYLSPLEDTSLISHRRETSANVATTAIPVVISDRPNSLRNNDDPSVARGDSNTLFVDGLPTDCTRREVGHLFRPFIGYKDIKVIHKEPRRSGDKALVFCFVEFIDSERALTAMRALQGYKFDDKKPNSPVLKISFAHFPFHPPHDRNDHRSRIPT